MYLVQSLSARCCYVLIKLNARHAIVSDYKEFNCANGELELQNWVVSYKLKLGYPVGLCYVGLPCVGLSVCVMSFCVVSVCRFGLCVSLHSLLK